MPIRLDQLNDSEWFCTRGCELRGKIVRTISRSGWEVHRLSGLGFRFIGVVCSFDDATRLLTV